MKKDSQFFLDGFQRSGEGKGNCADHLGQEEKVVHSHLAAGVPKWPYCIKARGKWQPDLQL